MISEIRARARQRGSFEISRWQVIEDFFASYTLREGENIERDINIRVGRNGRKRRFEKSLIFIIIFILKQRYTFFFLIAIATGLFVCNECIKQHLNCTLRRKPRGEKRKETKVGKRTIGQDIAVVLASFSCHKLFLPLLQDPRAQGVCVQAGVQVQVVDVTGARARSS